MTARWKIENEAFKALKRARPSFEHNFEHGYYHLCRVFLLLDDACNTEQIRMIWLYFNVGKL
jgi:hypothetical protein